MQLTIGTICTLRLFQHTQRSMARYVGDFAFWFAVVSAVSVNFHKLSKQTKRYLFVIFHFF